MYMVPNTSLVALRRFLLALAAHGGDEEVPARRSSVAIGGLRRRMSDKLYVRSPTSE